MRNLITSLGGAYTNQGKGSHSMIVLGDSRTSIPCINTNGMLYIPSHDSHDGVESGSNSSAHSKVTYPKFSSNIVPHYIVGQVRKILRNYFMQRGIRNIQYDTDVCDMRDI